VVRKIAAFLLVVLALVGARAARAQTCATQCAAVNLGNSGLIDWEAYNACVACLETSGGGASFASFAQTASGSTSLTGGGSNSVVTNQITETASATQTLPVCSVNNQFYVVWETNNSTGGYSPTFAAPAGWSLCWPESSTACGGTPPTPNTTANLTDIYSFQCDLTHEIWHNEGFTPANPLADDSTIDSALPTIGAATKVQDPNTANIVLNKPSTVVSSHTMLMNYYAQTSTAPTPPSGWNLIRADSCSGGTEATYYKVAGGSEPSSYTWTLAASYNAAALIDVGITAANPVDQISPAACGATPTLAGLTTTSQPETVITFGAAVNSSVAQVGFSEGSLAVAQPAAGILPISVGYLTANYPTTPSITLSGSGANEAAQMIALAPASTYTARNVLQGDGYAELAHLHGAFGQDSAISHFNINGDFNVKNPIYGAKGDGLTDDTAAIQAAFNAACAAGQAISTTGQSETLLFQAGTYLTSFPILSNCSTPVLFKGESENTAIIKATTGALYPVIMHEGSTYHSNMVTAAGGSLTGASLATGPGNSLVWGVNSLQFYDLEDAYQGTGVYPLGGHSAYTVEGFFNFAGGGGSNVYIIQSAGDDMNLKGTGALSLEIQTGSPNEIFGCITTSGSGHVCTSASGSITAGTTYEFEWSYDGSTLRVFYGVPGSTTTLAGSASATGSIVQAPSEVYSLGDGGTGLLMTGDNLQTNAHFIGQLDSIRLSTIARHTATYTAPTAKFASDGNTILLLNNENQSDVLLQASYVSGLGSVGTSAPPVWLPLHSNTLAGGNTHGGFYNIGMQGGSYSLLAIGTLYTTLDHVNAGGATHYGVKFFNNCYGTRIEHLTVAATPFAQSGITFSDNSGLTQLSWIFQTGSYYGMQMLDSGGTYSQLYLNPGASQVAAIDIGGTNLFHSYEIIEPDVDFESGGTQVPVKIWGSGNYQFIGGDYQPGTTNVADIAPGGSGSALTTTWVGGNVVTSGTAPLWSWKGSNPPASPATWVNPSINGGSLSAYILAGGAFTDNTDYARAFGDADVYPTTTVSNLGTCSSGLAGFKKLVRDCNANCATYLGTSFTGGGSTYVSVQCNGSAWELR
jgi:hypothetical protein